MLLPDLPLSALHDDFIAALAHTPLLLEAEPGAGKSTLAPLWVLAQAPAGQQVWLVQPRVLAAQALAQRLAALLGETPGQQVGYQVPYDSRMSADTRLVLMTPGILLQHLLQNPTLDGVACVMLDEIHERSVNQDMAWAFLQEVQILREDLQLVLMSATPDPALQQQITNRLFAPGRCFSVSTQYQPAKQNPNGYGEKIEDQLLRALLAYPQWQSTTVLVFLPGWREIENCASLIAQKFPIQLFPSLKVFRLHSRVPSNEQSAALDSMQGPRLILATNIAETSLTIADVTVVIDSGLARRADYEQRTGVTRLRTTRISMASAEQRRGRAGRVQAGHCIRLWSQDQPLAAADLPEIRATDYLPLALRIAHWGSPSDSLPWLEAPNKLALDFAVQQLQKMNLLDTKAQITAAGKSVSALGTHPRIAAFLLLHEKTISEAALLLSLSLHFELAAEQDFSALLDDATRELACNRQWQQQQKRWLGVLSLQKNTAAVDSLFLARAFNDRIGFKQDSGRYRLNSGMSVEPQGKLDAQWAVFPLINTKPKSHSGVGIALQLTAEQQRQLSQAKTTLVFKQQRWQEHTRWAMGGVAIDESWQIIPASEIAQKLLEHIRAFIVEKGFDHLAWSDKARALLERARLVVAYQLCELPALDNASLIVNLHQWLLPFLNESTRLDQLPLHDALEFYLGFDNCQKIAQLLPSKIDLPSGRSVVVDFANDGSAQISAKLQEFFGCEQLQLANGKIPLKIHLLSPNGSPLAITNNLQTFWQQAYPEVRKEMRGRYPRHPWPDNPLEHEATALTKRKLALQQPPS
ncbi:ATP-dependent helicase HrpB [Cellvibrio fibrivorans]|uniref:ATP-dependent helicase HrpB n=1 Tax=Cellvibrio fibrivorans TaxID=126350 RepID=A0ABU1V414_9GAMM|nr:ATP-dependent helicase HrpB [Cellvibrio fibrivorans]MDR7092023.1 ATP-dependent helicase HrpB [Cellvibrio fibrivorans]